MVCFGVQAIQKRREKKMGAEKSFMLKLLKAGQGVYCQITPCPAHSLIMITPSRPAELHYLQK